MQWTPKAVAKKRKRKSSGGKKGNPFERKVCDQLSEWWLGGKKDTVFWRTATSGARATVRKRKDLQTKGQHGDIGAVDPIGAPFTELITTELKRGYGSNSIADVLDRPSKRLDPPYVQWCLKAMRCAKDAGTPYWMVISRRDQHESIVCVPIKLAESLRIPNSVEFAPWAMASFQTKAQRVAGNAEDAHIVVIMPLATFLKLVSPSDIIAALSEYRATLGGATSGPVNGNGAPESTASQPADSSHVEPAPDQERCDGDGGASGVPVDAERLQDCPAQP